MAVGEQVTVTEKQRNVPTALWVWIGLEVLRFVVAAPFLRPGPLVFVAPWVFFGVLSALLAFGLWRRSRIAWVIALLLAIWGIFGGLLAFAAFFSGSEDVGWFVWGLALSLASVAALGSPGMRAWIKEPADRNLPTGA